MRGANPGDVWQFSHVHYCNENRQNHPTQKPEGTKEWYLHRMKGFLDPALLKTGIALVSN